MGCLPSKPSPPIKSSPAATTTTTTDIKPTPAASTTTSTRTTTEASTPSEKMSTESSPPPFTHLPQAQKTFSPPLISADNAFLGDVTSSGTSKLTHVQPCPDDDKPISAGFYRQEKGTPLTYTYTYHEMKIIVEGEFDISDATGHSVHAVPGDVLYFPKGSTITFSSPTYGLGFFVGQRKEGGA